ncbi:hypothetical protein Amsp01_015230 [Amycolatopsis sp. NBRC 101858]|uniref:sensor histidine kinase n=1 Tax=Amycolatopsis sp. NBRC 101858 TaxID=3032200 RepID=UPI0024A2A0F4|nr:histidine kinase [Amycolatopsis sp. NBRC 101858]GLY35499.1 hypothetical protein Amsp01_015230 [Amycolatopsis sp. NBRC 101858]
MSRFRVTGHQVTPFAAVLAAAFGLLFATAVFPGGAGHWPALACGFGLQLLATAVLARPATRPDLAMAATVVVAALLAGVLRPWPALLAVQAVPWVPVALAWATVRVFEGARSPRQLRVSAALAVAYPAFAAVTAPGGVVPAVLGAAVPLLGGTCVSLAVRLRRARADRAASLAAERAATAYRARVAERQRVAARLHDSLGHVLTLVVLRANALGANAADPEVRAAAGQIGDLGARGLTELRHALDLIDAPAPPATGTPGWREPTAELVDQARAAGQEVSLTVPDPAPEVDPAVSGALVRAVREGLTNARRHAPGAAVRVSLGAADARLELSVENDPPRAGAAVTPGSGRGLAALGRGIALLGGSCEHARTEAGGYALRVRFPAASVPASP